MKRNDFKPFKERLLAIRARLRGDVDRMRDPMFSCTSRLTRMPIHVAETAGSHYDAEMNVQLMVTKEEILAAIEAALESIEDGTYGTCAECGRRIAKARLNAIPYAVECVTCASG
ncbi:MAG: TraR/DksA family transcriptional regulator [Thermoguttaceae bacterium]|jgi:DnaK suppressor protein